MTLTGDSRTFRELLVLGDGRTQDRSACPSRLTGPMMPEHEPHRMLRFLCVACITGPAKQGPLRPSAEGALLT